MLQQLGRQQGSVLVIACQQRFIAIRRPVVLLADPGQERKDDARHLICPPPNLGGTLERLSRWRYCSAHITER
jgi:hypothetical protein